MEAGEVQRHVGSVAEVAAALRKGFPQSREVGLELRDDTEGEGASAATIFLYVLAGLFLVLVAALAGFIYYKTRKPPEEKDWDENELYS